MKMYNVKKLIIHILYIG